MFTAYVTGLTFPDRPVNSPPLGDLGARAHKVDFVTQPRQSSSLVKDAATNKGNGACSR